MSEGAGADEAAFETRTATLTPGGNSGPVWLTLLAWLLAIAGASAAGKTSATGLTAVFATLSVAIPLIFYAGFKTGRAGAAPLATPKDPLLRADRRGLWWCEQLVLPRERFDNAIIRPTTGGKSLLLLGKKGDFEQAMSVTFANADESRAAMRAMGLDVDAATMELREPTPMTYSLPLGVAFIVLFSALGAGGAIAGERLLRFASPEVGIPVALAGMGSWLALFVWGMFASDSRIVVGADGVLVSWSKLRRFVPYSDVAAVELTTNAVLLRRKDNSTFRIQMGNGNASYRGDRDALAARIRAAIAQHEGGASAPAALALGAHESESPAAWVERLANLLGGSAGGPRSAALRAEDLWRVLDDGEAPPATRAAAAVALRAGGGADDRTRIRVAAEASASPEFKATLARIADAEHDDRAALEGALAQAQQQRRG